MNGWTNRATWLVNIWYNPTCADDVKAIKEQIFDGYDEIQSGLFKDMLCIDDINWDELKEAFSE